MFLIWHRFVRPLRNGQNPPVFRFLYHMSYGCYSAGRLKGYQDLGPHSLWMHGFTASSYQEDNEIRILTLVIVWRTVKTKTFYSKPACKTDFEHAKRKEAAPVSGSSFSLSFFCEFYTAQTELSAQSGKSGRLL